MSPSMPVGLPPDPGQLPPDPLGMPMPPPAPMGPPPGQFPSMDPQAIAELVAQIFQQMASQDHATLQAGQDAALLQAQELVAQMIGGGGAPPADPSAAFSEGTGPPMDPSLGY